MKRILKLSDDLTLNETLDLQNKIKSGRLTGFDTKVLITARNCHSDGSFSQEIKTNKTSLPGRTKLLEDNFPVTTNIEQHIFLNDNVLGETDPNTGNSIGVPQTVANTPSSQMPRNNPDLFRRRKVQYWCAGDGAMNKTLLNQSYPPHNTDTRLFHMIPFRIVRRGSPLEDAKRRQYKFAVEYNQNSPLYGYIGYYFKKINFASLDGINMVVDKQLYTPSWADTDTDLNADRVGYENKFKGDKVQSNYIDMSMHIDSEEFKEWFEVTDGTLGNATISEIGLVTGLDCTRSINNDNSLTPIEDVDENLANYSTLTMNSEIFDAELFAHLTFDPYPVSRDNATIDFDYRIYS